MDKEANTTPTGERYYKGGTYELIDKDGNVVGTSKGDNGYVWQSAVQGIPISVNSKGEWYTNPYIEKQGNTIISHIPEWFKTTDEYSDWINTYRPQMDYDTLTDERIQQYNALLNGLGDNGGTRIALRQSAANYGMASPERQNDYAKYMIAIANEIGGGEAANLKGIYSDEDMSVLDFAREVKNLSKEDLSRIMTNSYQTLADGSAGTLQDDDKILLAALTSAILNLVDDNYATFGDDKEFQGLLEASVWQKIGRGLGTASATFTENNILGLIPRALYGITNLIQGKGFDLRIEDSIEQVLGTKAEWGANLEGLDTAESLGVWSGAIVNMVASVKLMKGVGKIFNGKFAGTPIMNFLTNSNGTITGAVAQDFFLNDLPMDMVLFINDVARYQGDVGRALWDPEETQPLTGIPFLTRANNGQILPTGLGPQVPGGLVMNMAGDILVDLAPEIIRTTLGALDNKTGGTVTRFKEHIAIKNFQIQESLSNTLVGRGWSKILKSFMGEEEWAKIKKAKQESIRIGSTDPYIQAHNLWTMSRHSGAEVVRPLYDKLDEELGITKDIERFVKNADKYGGVGETRVEWQDIERLNKVDKYKVVPDTVPTQVKQALLDTDRLSQLKGEEINEGGILTNPARDKEIAEIEERLNNTPDDVKDFAIRFSTLNKRVEEMAVTLGLKTEEWVKAMQLDPRFENYMVRQVVTPGEGMAKGVTGGNAPAILSKGRKAYYSENYIDPTIALEMKLEAIGRAYVWNEQAKLLASFEAGGNRLIAGKGGVEVAQKLEANRQELSARTELRKQLGYDELLDKNDSNMSTITTSVRKMKDTLDLPNRLSIEAVYTKTDPNVQRTITDFEDGKITFGDGVKEVAGISDSEAASIIKNTYQVGDEFRSVAPDGTPYKYNVEDNVITSMEHLEGAAEISAAVEGASNGKYKLSPETVEQIGVPNSKSIITTTEFYKNNFPDIPGGPTFKLDTSMSSWGYIWRPTNYQSYGWHLEDGHIKADQYEVFIGGMYRKGNEAQLLRDKQGEVASGFKPRNTATAESTPIHENGHSTMVRLAVEELNHKADEKLITLPDSASELGKMVLEQRENLEELFIKNALENMGLAYNEATIRKQAATISDYASSVPRDWDGRIIRTVNGNPSHVEVFSEAMRMYRGNGENSSRFCLEIVEQMRKFGERFAMAANPEAVMIKNGLDTAGLFKDGQYNFPAKATTSQKAKWLNEKRQANPYLKQDFTEDIYKKANLWDTYFQKEIYSYNPNAKTSAPDTLIKKSGDFIDKLSSTAAKTVVEEIRKVGGDFSEDLAALVLSGNSNDVATAMDNFIIRKVDDMAQELAAKMDGDLNRARATVWSEDRIRNSMTDMVVALTPESGAGAAQERVWRLFDEQAKGYTSFELLPIETKKLLAEKEELLERLHKENAHSMKVGKKIDKQLAKKYSQSEVTQVISYKQGGEDVYVVVNDPVTANILKHPVDYKSHGVGVETMTAISQMLARTYRLGTTGASIPALIRNVLRDPLQATIQGGFNPFAIALSPEAFYKTLRNYGLDEATITNVTDRLRNWSSASTLSYEMRQRGLKSPSTLGYTNKVEKISKQARTKFDDSKIVNVAELPLELWEQMLRNQIAQQSFIKNYRKTNDVNKAMGAAMFDASNSTTNFAHTIAHWNNFTSTVPYLSSAINGTASFWRQFNVDPLGMIMRITGGVMVPVMAITAWNLSDPDRRAVYMNLPEWYRDGHLVLIDTDGGTFALPLPDEITQYTGTARRLIEYTQEASPYGLGSIMAQGVFGFLPVDMDGFFGEDGSIDWGQGFGQLANGLMPQAATLIYEVWAQKDMYTGADISNYSTFNKWINGFSNIFGTGAKSLINDIGMLCGASEKQLIGLSTADTIARDLFGIGFDNAKNQFMELIGNSRDGNKAPTGLYLENEQLLNNLSKLDKEMAFATDERKAEIEVEKAELKQKFIDRVSTLVNKYMQLYSMTGGLEEWQKKKIIQILNFGGNPDAGEFGGYQAEAISEADLEQYALARQRYVDAGLPAGPSLMSGGSSIALKAAIDRFYGTKKQATTDFRAAIKNSGLKDIRNRFYDFISTIYDEAEKQNLSPDYDLIERTQARFLQAFDATLIPIINEYGITILNNADFINEVRSLVNGMIPSDDWKQSARNAKKFLSSKDFPTATVDVKKWLIQRYQSGMRDRNLTSDPEVTNKLAEIVDDLNAGRGGAAKGKIESLKKGIDRASYYISATDLKLLSDYYNMVK